MFYTYIYYDPSRNNEPIYVGKGQNKRAWIHLKSNKKSPFISRLKHMKKENITPVIGIYSGIDEELALLLEAELIQKLGRKDLGKGTLLNLTDGGEGNGNPSADTRIKIGNAKRDKKDSQETKNKRSKSLLGHSVSKETRDKQREIKKEKFHRVFSQEGPI